MTSPTAMAEFVNLAGAKIGTAILTETSQGVLIVLEVTGLPAGEWVAFHVHETGNCDHQTAHESAGGHLNSTNAEHGYLTERGPHAGDMPNQHVGADGVLRVPYSLDAPFSLVDLSDVAEAAATVLTEPGHGAATYELAGPRPVTVRQVAAVLGARAERQSVDGWAQGQRLPAYALEALSAMFGHYDRHGLVGNPGVRTALLGRAPHDPLDVLGGKAADPPGTG